MCLLYLIVLNYKCRDKKKANQEQKLLIKQLDRNRREAEKEKEKEKGSMQCELQTETIPNVSAVLILLCVVYSFSSFFLVALIYSITVFLCIFMLNISISKASIINIEGKELKLLICSVLKYDWQIICRQHYGGLLLYFIFIMARSCYIYS